jgi:hypothetical protein
LGAEIHFVGNALAFGLFSPEAERGGMVPLGIIAKW